MASLTHLFYSEICHGKWHKDVLENVLLRISSLSPNEWVVISTVYPISHRRFPELTAILFWCSTKLPVLQYILLYRCYIAKLFITTTKQTRKYSWNGGFVSNVYISKTNSTWGQLTKHGWAPSHESISIYIRLWCPQALLLATWQPRILPRLYTFNNFVHETY